MQNKFPFFSISKKKAILLITLFCIALTVIAVVYWNITLQIAEEYLAENTFVIDAKVSIGE